MNYGGFPAEYGNFQPAFSAFPTTGRRDAEGLDYVGWAFRGGVTERGFTELLLQ